MRVHFDHQVFSLQSTGGNTRYHYELTRHLAAKQELFLGLTPTSFPFFDLAAENVRVVGRPTSLRPSGRLYMLNEALNTAYALSAGATISTTLPTTGLIRWFAPVAWW